MPETSDKEMTPADILGSPMHLPCGATLKNRLMKSATSENLSDDSHAPTPGLATVYERLAKGGAGLLVTGNVMVVRDCLGEPNNVVVEDERDLPALSAWAYAATTNGADIWAQINHPGKQSPKGLSRAPAAPSAIPFSPPMDRFFNTPRAMSGEEIEDLVFRFGNAAGIMKKAGFTGVQIHGAHGYLASQFLSPRHNQRADKWGGSLENRMRFLLEVYRSMRKAVGPDFPVGVKLNSGDFKKEGFTEDESADVCKVLDAEGVDLLEISGGSYESPAMTGRMSRGTRDREAYFLAFARTIRKEVACPLAVTGGFRTAEGMAEAVASGDVDVVGLARPLVLDPELPNKVLAGREYESTVKPVKTGVRAIDRFAILEVSYYELQLARMAKGRDPDPDMGAWSALIRTMLRTGFDVFRPRRARG
ncbi:MAG: NADH:flavin oxidoreductase/NADH oxidase family protein [Desulfatibacillaceae bacterium]